MGVHIRTKHLLQVPSVPSALGDEPAPVPQLGLWRALGHQRHHAVSLTRLVADMELILHVCAATLRPLTLSHDLIHELQQFSLGTQRADRRYNIEADVSY